MKIVIFEGIDCAGKSTVIQELRKMLRNRSHPLFIDRFIHSNYVYEKLKNTENILELEDIVYKLVNYFNVIVIYLDVSPEIAYNRVLNKNEFCSLDYLKKCKDLFEESFLLFSMKFVRINADKPIPEVLSNILEIIKSPEKTPHFSARECQK